MNGIKTDNRIKNLRVVSASENQQNRFQAFKNESKMGVFHASKNSYRASIKINGKTKHIGSYPTQDMAHAAYIAAKIEHHDGCKFWGEI